MFTELGKAEWSEALGQKMVTKVGEKEARMRLQSPPHPQEDPGREERNRRDFFFCPGLTCPL